MKCPVQYMLSATGCVFLSSKPQATLVRGSLAGVGISSSNRQFLLACNASSSSSPPQEDGADCNEEECAPEKEVRTAILDPVSVEWPCSESGLRAGREPERGVAGGGEDPGGGHLPAQEEEGMDRPRREGHRRPDQYLLRRGQYCMLFLHDETWFGWTRAQLALSFFERDEVTTAADY
jgi:hypothetical protein